MQLLQVEIERVAIDGLKAIIEELKENATVIGELKAAIEELAEAKQTAEAKVAKLRRIMANPSNRMPNPPVEISQKSTKQLEHDLKAAETIEREHEKTIQGLKEQAVELNRRLHKARLANNEHQENATKYRKMTIDLQKKDEESQALIKELKANAEEDADGSKLQERITDRAYKAELSRMRQALQLAHYNLSLAETAKGQAEIKMDGERRQMQDMITKLTAHVQAKRVEESAGTDPSFRI